jgi:hypothetical protein
MPDSDEIRALSSRVIDIANDVIQLRCSAPEAALELDRLRASLVLLEAALRPFVGLAAEWDYNPDRRPEIEREILSAAETLRRNVGT